MQQNNNYSDYILEKVASGNNKATEIRKPEFGDYVISYGVVSMFGSAWVLGRYVNEHTIVPVEEKEDHPRSYFNKQSTIYLIDKDREPFKSIISRSSVNNDELFKKFVEHMENADESKMAVINEPFTVR